MPYDVLIFQSKKPFISVFLGVFCVVNELVLWRETLTVPHTRWPPSTCATPPPTGTPPQQQHDYYSLLPNAYMTDNVQNIQTPH